MATETKLSQNLLRDLFFNRDFSLTNTGDLLTVSGKANLNQALFHRLITVPGTLVHRPTYGIGVKRWQNDVGSVARQRELAILIKDQFELDPRVEEVTGVRINQDTIEPGLFTVKVEYQAVGFGEIVEEFDPFELTL